MALAERVLLPRDLATRFPAAALVGHFLLARRAFPSVDGWALRERDGWTLMVQGSLPAIDLVDTEGAQIGWMLGHPIHEAKVLEREIQVPFVARTPDVIQRIEQYLDDLAGRFLAIVFAPGVARAYPDTIGSLAVLYSPEREMLSSSPFLIPYEDSTEDEADLLSALRIDATRGRLLFGIAPRRGMHRLLPNHVLDLTTWTARRTWPRQRGVWRRRSRARPHGCGGQCKTQSVGVGAEATPHDGPDCRPRFTDASRLCTTVPRSHSIPHPPNSRLERSHGRQRRERDLQAP